MIEASKLGDYLNDCTLRSNNLQIGDEAVELDDSLFDSKLFNESVQASLKDRDFPLASLSAVCNELLYNAEGVIMKYQKDQIIEEAYEEITGAYIILHGSVGLQPPEEETERRATAVLGAGDSFFEDAVEYAHHLYAYVKGVASPQSARNSPASRARV